MYGTSWRLEEHSVIVVHCGGSAPFYGVNVPHNTITATRIWGRRGVKRSHYHVRLRKRLKCGGAPDVRAHVVNETALRCLILACRPSIRHDMMQDRPEAEVG